MDKKTISIVTPCFNEELGITSCYETIKHLMETELPDYNYEHIFCDNASTDKTVTLLKEVAADDKNVKIIVNSRNFGILRNNFNGVMNATGDAVVLFLPVDLQDPPELIPQFVERWREGYEIVYGIRAEREENIFLRASRKMYYRLLSKITYVNYPPDVGDYQLVDSCVIDVMKRSKDANPFMRLMTFDCGFRSTGVSYTWRKRDYGKSQNSLLSMFDQGLNGLISFSGLPLRLALFAGVAISAVSILYAILVFVLALLGLIDSQAGMPTVIVALFFFGGVQLFFIGILGEYILAIFNQVKERPLVVERERINFDADPH